MPLAVVTGSGGLIGSESVAFLIEQGFRVIGLDNDMRAYFFGPEATTRPATERLLERYGEDFEPTELDIRDGEGVMRLFARHAREIELVIHTAAQPSHDWAASEPHTDFAVNATGTLNLLEAARARCPDATFIFTSTNKVYGDRPNFLPLVDVGSRLELPPDHRWYRGIDLSMPIDTCTHSLFGVSKVAADLLVQEYGRYFGMPTVCFRGGCLTGPQHAGAQLHGFLSYLMRCTTTGEPYTVFGCEGKQVRDNIHSHDVVRAFHAFHLAPRSAAVYNLGGGREANVSMLEAIERCEQIAGRALDYEISEQARIGDHRWWISDLSEFRRDYPDWEMSYGIDRTLQEIHDANVERWLASRVADG
jgi:CDP-paratose 2-epimerase